jgi:hypothetical protein
LKKNIFFVFSGVILFLLLAAGCGGGGVGGGPTPPAEYKITVSVSPSEVYEGESVSCFAQVDPVPPNGISICWSQQPSTPAGTFLPPSGSSTEWRAPMVDKTMTFSIVASFALVGREFSGSATIVVLPKGSPPVTPPGVSLEYPTDEQIVGSGVYLTLIGSITQGSNPLKELVVLDNDGTILQRWSVTPGDFRVDLSNYGSPGRKTIRVRAVDTVGLYGEVQIVVNNDDDSLDQSAREFLKRYNVLSDGGTVRMGNLSNGPYSKPIKVYINTVQQWKSLVQQACDFWTRYTNIQFELVIASEAESPCIIISDKTSEDPGVIAGTRRGYVSDPHEIDATVELYKIWMEYNDEVKACAIAHELGHTLLTASEITEFGPNMIMWPYGPATLKEEILPPVVQKSVYLLYSHAPDWIP